MNITIKMHTNDRTTRSVRIKSRTRNKYGLPTSLAMERLLAKSMR